MAMRRDAIVRRPNSSYSSRASSAQKLSDVTGPIESIEDTPTAAAVWPVPQKPGNNLWKNAEAFFDRRTAGYTYLKMPDGESLAFRSFRDPQGAAPSADYQPSPVIRIREGQQAQIRLETHRRKHHHSGNKGLSVHGQHGSKGVCLETAETQTYQWQPRSAGTWFYQSHASTPLQFEMGLFGVIVVDAEPDHSGRPRAYRNGPGYDIERIWVFDDVDPSWHRQDLEGVCDGNRGVTFNPKYFLINGVPNTEALHHPDVAVEAKLGDKVLLRLMNASFSLVKVEIEKLKADIISVDGNALGSEERPWTHWIPVSPSQPVRLATACRHDLLIDLDPATGSIGGPGEYKVTIEFLDGARRQVQNAGAKHPAHVGRATTTIRVL